MNAMLTASERQVMLLQQRIDAMRIEIDEIRGRVGMTEVPDGVPCEVAEALTRGQRRILARLLRTPGRAVRRGDILDAYLVNDWGDREPFPRCIDVQVHLMRRRLALIPKREGVPRVDVWGVYGVGYAAKVVA